MKDQALRVFVVDDNPSIRSSLSRIIRSAGHEVETFSNASAFLSQDPHERNGCLILDLMLPGMDGLEVQEHLLSNGVELPIIFLTGRGSVHLSVRAIKSGAIDFLLKPIAANELLDAVSCGLRRRQEIVQVQGRQAARRTIYNTLTPREREVCALVAEGLLNKQIAGELGIAEKTVKIHRARVMTKLAAKSVPDLVRFMEALKHTPHANWPSAVIPATERPAGVQSIPGFQAFSSYSVPA